MNAASRHRTIWKTIARGGAILSAVTLFGGYVYLSQRTPSSHGLPIEPNEQAAVPEPAERTVAPSSKLAILVTAKLVREPSHEDVIWPPRDDKDPRIPSPDTTIRNLPAKATPPSGPMPKPPKPTRANQRVLMPGSKSDDTDIVPKFLGVLRSSDGTELERLKSNILNPRPPEPTVIPGSKSSRVDGEWMVAELLRKMLGVKPSNPGEPEKQKPEKAPQLK